MSINLQVSTVKIIRNKQTGQLEGYGFVEFYSHAAAEKVLQSYSGSMMPNTDQPFRLNWASFAGERRADAGFIESPCKLNKLQKERESDAMLHCTELCLDRCYCMVINYVHTL